VRQSVHRASAWGYPKLNAAVNGLPSPAVVAAMREILMLRGLTSVRYHTPDLKRATRWYAELLGIEPYREQLG
jgi:hypothetical protein